MRIVIVNAGDETVLCDGADPSLDRSAGPSDLRIRGSVNIQTAEALRAVGVTVHDRGNGRSEISFAVARECASVAAAEVWIAQHLVNCPRVGAVKLLASESGGGLTIVTLAIAAIPDISFEHVGVAVIVSYTIVGGVFS
jgi:hypothetical protein